MSYSSSLSEQQIATIQSWADQGDQLAEIQRKLASELEIKVTYMELRFLLDDIGVSIKEEEKPAPPEDSDPDLDTEEEPQEGEEVLDGNDVRISLAAVQRPGALISGSVHFAGGEEAEWWLDQMGQLGMDPKNEDFRPNQEQMMAFQKELQRVVQEQGGF